MASNSWTSVVGYAEEFCGVELEIVEVCEL